MYWNKNTKPSIKTAVIKIPPNFEGIDLSTPNINKKYHSGRIFEGVFNGSKISQASSWDIKWGFRKKIEKSNTTQLIAITSRYEEMQ